MTQRLLGDAVGLAVGPNIFLNHSSFWTVQTDGTGDGGTRTVGGVPGGEPGGGGTRTVGGAPGGEPGGAGTMTVGAVPGGEPGGGGTSTVRVDLWM